MAWERNIRHLHHIVALLTTCLTDLPVKPNQAACSAIFLSYSPRYTGVHFLPSTPSTFSQRTCYTSSTQSIGARPPKRRRRRFTRTYAHTDIIKHQLKVYSTHVCPSVLEAPCSHPESCTRCAYVGKKCDIPSTPLPWQCLPCELADPCFMAAGCTQNAYTTRPLSPDDETMIMMQALHDK